MSSLAPVGVVGALALGAMVARGLPLAIPVAAAALLLVGLGWTLAAGIRWVEIDQQSARVLLGRGPRWLGRSTLLALSEVATVEVSPRVGRESGRVSGYTVNITALDQQELAFFLTRYDDARRVAERLARALGADLLDEARGGVKVAVPAASLRGSLQERLRRSPEVRQLPQVPRISVGLLGTEGRRFVYQFGPLGPSAPQILALLTALVLLAAGGALIENDWVDLPSWMLIPAWLPGAAIGLLALERAFHHRERIEIDDERLVVTHRSPWGARTVTLAVSEIEELDLVQVPRAVRGLAVLPGGGAALVARTADTAVAFGQDLNPTELEWLRDLTHFMLAHEP